MSISEYTRAERKAARLIAEAQQEARERARLASLIIMQAPADVVMLALDQADPETARDVWRMYLGSVLSAKS